MSAVGTLNALCPAIGFALGGSVAAFSSPRVAMAVAGAIASLATLAFLRLPTRGLLLTPEASTPIPDEATLIGGTVQ
jgi:hypothetical protein